MVLTSQILSLSGGNSELRSPLSPSAYLLQRCISRSQCDGVDQAGPVPRCWSYDDQPDGSCGFQKECGWSISFGRYLHPSTRSAILLHTKIELALFVGTGMHNVDEQCSGPGIQMFQLQVLEADCEPATRLSLSHPKSLGTTSVCNLIS